MADFVLESQQDAAKFGFEQEDVGIRSEMEGGYVLTRARHTRTPRRTWKTGFTNIEDDDKEIFETFFNAKGTFLSFTYQVPVNLEIVTVRFKTVPKYEYKGIGDNFRWDINEIYLEEV